MILTDKELDQIEARLAAATGGAWRAYVEGRDHQSGSRFVRTAGDDIEMSDATAADSDFTANARQDIAALIAAVRDGQSSIDKLRSKPRRLALMTLGLLILAVVAGLVGAGLAIGATEAQFRRHLDERSRHWQRKVESELPVGASREQVREWMARNFPDRITEPGGDPRNLYVDLDTFDAPWPGFPCTFWMITLNGHLNDTGQLSERKVARVGACV